MDESQVTRAQQKAAELVLEDEAWRDGLVDEQVKALLDEALAMVDQALAQHAAEGTLNEDVPYVLADEARAMLREKAMALTGGDASSGAASEAVGDASGDESDEATQSEGAVS